MYIISSCLCGVNCKYNGLNNLNEKCLDIFNKGEAILVCPEVLGGLKIPRTPAEMIGSAEDILNGLGKIITKDNKDVSKEFINGAYEVLKVAKENNIKKAILKEGSPSCGVNFIYDGTFTNKKIKGSGLTTTILNENGIEVISDTDI